MRAPFQSEAAGRHAFARLVLPCLLLLAALLVGAVIAHPLSLSGLRTRLLWLNFALLTGYALAALWLSRQSGAAWKRAYQIAARLALLLVAVLVANDLVELFVRDRPFPLIIAPVFLSMAILAAAGSATWVDTRSTMPAILAGVCCVLLAVPLFLCVAACLHLALSTRAELPLQQSFAASGMNDPTSFLVQNILESASEILLRFPLVALFLSAAAVASARVSSISSRARITVAPLLFAAGAVALKHAGALPREQRPPFVIAGVLLVAVGLSSVQTIWSALRRA